MLRPALELYNAEVRILEAKYDHMTAHEVVQQCIHLRGQSQLKIEKMISQYYKLFSGKLGCYVRQKFSIFPKDPKTAPIFCNPYPVPLIHQVVFKKEL